MLLWITISTSIFLIIISSIQWIRIKGLEKSKSGNAILPENITEALVITDENYCITYWNRKAEQMLGYKDHEAIGNRLSHLLKSKSEEFSIETLRTIINERKSWNGNITYTHKNGQPVYSNVTTSVITDDQGEIISTISIIRDFSSLKEMISSLEKDNVELSNTISYQRHEIETLFNRITNGFFALDYDFSIRYINPVAANTHQLDIVESIGKNFISLTQNELGNTEFTKRIMQAAESKINQHFTVFFKPNGKWYENWIYCDTNGISVFYRDITTEKKVQMKLEENLERLNLIVDATNDAIWDWEMKSNVIWGNEKYYELLGNIKEGEDNFTTFANRIFPEDQEGVSSSFQKFINEKKSDLTFEYRYVLENGNVLHLLGKTKTLYDEEGLPYRSVGSIQDITLQKTFQQQILQQNEISESLISSIPGLFFLINAEGKILRTNNNQVYETNYLQEELIYANTLDFIDEIDQLKFIEKFKVVLEQGINQADELQIITKGGKKIPILFSGVRINYHNQPCVMGVGIDISDRVQYQKELRALTLHLEKIREEERTIIAREIHDELGQQLTGLRMNLSWIKMKTEALPIKNKIMDSIDLIDNTMKTVRRISTRLRPGILDDLGLIATLEWQMEEFQKRYDIPAQFETNVSRVELNAEITTSVFRIFQESLTNIAKHSQANQISASITILENQLTLIISDNGIGFDSDMIKDKKTFGIIGMRERTLLMNGQLQIESQCDNGTVVKVIIPLNKS
jgi:PAS domain S-box-containing protein